MSWRTGILSMVGLVFAGVVESLAYILWGWPTPWLADLIAIVAPSLGLAAGFYVGMRLDWGPNPLRIGQDR